MHRMIYIYIAASGYITKRDEKEIKELIKFRYGDEAEILPKVEHTKNEVVELGDKIKLMSMADVCVFFDSPALSKSNIIELGVAELYGKKIKRIDYFKMAWVN